MEWRPPDALAKRVEEVCLNAWPAPQEIHYDGWVIRLADGKTRRTNSVNILHEGTLPFAEKVAYCERIYRRHGLDTHFRILSTGASAIDEALQRRGYEAQDETSTLYMDFAVRSVPPARDKVDLIEDAPSSEWLAARAQISGNTQSEMRKVEKILQHLALPALFAAVRDENGIVRSVAKGAVHDGIVCLNLVATDPAFRRRGYSQDCVSAILRWAQRGGARGACLQVVSANAPAIALYQKLGFGQELYRYHYRHRAIGE